VATAAFLRQFALLFGRPEIDGRIAGCLRAGQPVREIGRRAVLPHVVGISRDDRIEASRCAFDDGHVDDVVMTRDVCERSNGTCLFFIERLDDAERRQS